MIAMNMVGKGIVGLGMAGMMTLAIIGMVSGDKSKALVLYCNGPFCQASKRVSEQLVAGGFTNVRRYQLGIPIWRALGGPTEIGRASWGKSVDLGGRRIIKKKKKK